MRYRDSFRTNFKSFEIWAVIFLPLAIFFIFIYFYSQNKNALVLFYSLTYKHKPLIVFMGAFLFLVYFYLDLETFRMLYTIDADA